MVVLVATLLTSPALPEGLTRGRVEQRERTSGYRAECRHTVLVENVIENGPVSGAMPGYATPRINPS